MNIILGLGISGLVAAHLINNTTVVAERVSKFLVDKATVPQIIHYSSDTKSFVNKYFNSVATRLYKIGYYYNGKVYDCCPDELKLLYYAKSRNVKVDSNRIKEFSTVMTEGKNNFLGFEISVNDLATILLKNIKNDIVISKINKIDSLNKVIYCSSKKSCKKIPYDNLISTLPANLFFRLNGDENTAKKFKFSDIYVVKEHSELDQFGNKLRSFGFDYIYSPEKQTSWYRVNFLDNTYNVYEFANKPNLHYVKFENAQLQNDVEFEMPKNTIALGRFAQWMHKIKINDVIERCINFENLDK